MSDGFRYYLDRHNKRFLRTINGFYFESSEIGETRWKSMGAIPEGMEDPTIAALGEFEITDCQNGHRRTPENLCMGKDGYLRCKQCREDKSEKNKNRRNFEDRNRDNKRSIPVPLPADGVLEFNTNASVYRDNSKLGWGEISLRFNLSRKEAKTLGEKLIEISQME